MALCGFGVQAREATRHVVECLFVYGESTPTTYFRIFKRLNYMFSLYILIFVQFNLLFFKSFNLILYIFEVSQNDHFETNYFFLLWNAFLNPFVLLKN